MYNIWLADTELDARVIQMRRRGLCSSGVQSLMETHTCTHKLTHSQCGKDITKVQWKHSGKKPQTWLQSFSEGEMLALTSARASAGVTCTQTRRHGTACHVWGLTEDPIEPNAADILFTASMKQRLTKDTKAPGGAPEHVLGWLECKAFSKCRDVSDRSLPGHGVLPTNDLGSRKEN